MNTRKRPNRLIRKATWRFLRQKRKAEQRTARRIIRFGNGVSPVPGTRRGEMTRDGRARTPCNRLTGQMGVHLKPAAGAGPAVPGAGEINRRKD